MRNTKGIKPHEFKPGQSGNPSGRPKKLPELNDLLADVLGQGGENNVAKEIIEALSKKAKKGDVRAAEVLMNRGWGMPKQQIQSDAEVIVTIKHES